MHLRKILVVTLPVALLISWQRAAFAHYESAEEKEATQKQLKANGTPVLPKIDPWLLLEMAISPAYASSNVNILVEGAYRIIKSNGLPNHATGAFPNQGNPNTIREQNYTFKLPADPRQTGATTPLGMYPFGVAINGIPFDPGAAEWWNNNPSSGWQYEAMALGPRLGLDQNNAHVQPNGAYHYHGLPTGLLEKLSSAPKPVLLGYAADGFPIYAPFSYSDPMNQHSPMKKLKSSYRLKNGTRPDGPSGSYDGTFVQDYEYSRGWGDLDDSNGRYGITSEYPKGTYYYVITDSFPFIPRGFKGTPDPSFRNRGGTQQMGPGGGRRLGPPGNNRGFGPPGSGSGFGPPGGGPGFGPPGGDGLRPPGGGEGLGPPRVNEGYAPPRDSQGLGPPGGQGYGPMDAQGLGPPGGQGQGPPGGQGFGPPGGQGFGPPGGAQGYRPGQNSDNSY